MSANGATSSAVGAQQPERGDRIPLSEDPTKANVEPAYRNGAPPLEHHNDVSSTNPSSTNPSSTNRASTNPSYGTSSSSTTTTGSALGSNNPYSTASTTTNRAGTGFGGVGSTETRGTTSALDSSSSPLKHLKGTAAEPLAQQVHATLGKTKTHFQRALDQYDLTPRNQLVAHSIWSIVTMIFLVATPSILLKYNPILATARGLFGIANKDKDGSKFMYVILLSGLAASSYALSGPLWGRAKNSLQQIIVVRLLVAAACYTLCFVLRLGSDALLLVGTTELVAAIVMKQTEGVTTQELAETAREGADEVVRAVEVRAKSA